MASLAPPAPRPQSPLDATQPTMRRATFEPAIAAAEAARPSVEATAPEFANPASNLERTMAAGDYGMPAPTADLGIGQTLMGAVPQHIYDQIANAPPPPPQAPVHQSLPPPPVRTFKTPPPEAPRSSKGLWAAVAVGMVLFVIAALAVLTQLR